MKPSTLLLGLVVLLPVTPVSAAEVVRRALVIAHNGSGDPSLPPLRFADDDGALWAEALQRLGVDVVLLVDPDETTRSLHPRVLAHARAPTLEAVIEEASRLREASLADRAAGKETDTFVIYVGHGSTDEAGRTYFTLAGGTLDRSTFHTRVVDALESDYVHVIVDACRASGVVGRRGATNPEVMASLRETLAREQARNRPFLGVLYAESENGETHEWSRIRAGVFSHIARSGLMGAADVNHDGRVEYSELAAFVAASLEGVRPMPTRLNVQALPPVRDPRRPLVGPAPEGPTLTLSPLFEHARVSVEDAHGVRLADVRRAKRQQVTLRLPAREEYWVRAPDGEARLARRHLGTGTFRLQPRELHERGPAEEALRRGLFAMPLDRPFYERYVAEAGFTPVDFTHTPPPAPEGNLGPAAGDGAAVLPPRTLIPAIAGSALLLASGISWTMALAEHRRLVQGHPDLRTPEAVHGAAARGRAYQTAAAVLLGAGVAGLGVAAGLHVMGAQGPSITLSLGTEQSLVHMSGRWP